MRIRYGKTALKSLQGYDRPTRERIRQKINDLTLTPPIGDIKALIGEKGRYRLRVGKYRVKYEYIIDKAETILHIVNIDSRGDIYK